MGKPHFDVYERFKKKYFELCKSCGKEQYLVPYLMSSHPGCTLSDAVELSLMLKRDGYSPEQVQDFYPTPGTSSTVMYYTGLDPLTLKSVYVATDPHEKQLQRALLQFKKPENARLVREALKKCGREDLIGFGPNCLIRPEGNAPVKKSAGLSTSSRPTQKASVQSSQRNGSKPKRDKKTYGDKNKQGKPTPKGRKR